MQVTDTPGPAAMPRARELEVPWLLPRPKRSLEPDAASATRRATEYLGEGLMPRLYPASDDEADYRWVVEGWDWEGRDHLHP
jgi:hypothetical protein